MLWHHDRAAFQGWQNYCYWIGFLIGCKKGSVLVGVVPARELVAELFYWYYF
jgi:hypothetical protein